MDDSQKTDITGRTGGPLLIILLGALTAFAPLSIDMYLPAFPAMAKELQTSTDSIQQTLAVFFLGMAAGQLFYGPLADRFGRRPPLLWGIAIFTAASIGCALAPDVRFLWLSRLAQALGGCSGVVIARAVVRDLFDTTQAAWVFSQLMLVMGAAPILAPLLGGHMLAFTGWRGIFWLLAGFGFLCFAAVFSGLPESHVPDPGSSPPAAVARKFQTVLCDRAFWPVAVSAAFVQAAMFAYITASPGVFIERFHVSPEHYGLFFGANAFALILASQGNARLLHFLPPRRIFSGALGIMTVCGFLTAAVGWNGMGGLWGIAGMLWLMLFCLGFVNPNAIALAMARQGSRAGTASALLGSMQFFVATFSGSAVTFFSPWGDTLRIMTLVMAASTLIAWIVFRWDK